MIDPVKSFHNVVQSYHKTSSHLSHPPSHSAHAHHRSSSVSLFRESVLMRRWFTRHEVQCQFAYCLAECVLTPFHPGMSMPSTLASHRTCGCAELETIRLAKFVMKRPVSLHVSEQQFVDLGRHRPGHRDVSSTLRSFAYVTNPLPSLFCCQFLKLFLPCTKVVEELLLPIIHCHR